MKKLLNQRGVGALEMVLVVLLLAAIGAAGYFAFQARQANSDTASSKNVPTENTEVKPDTNKIEEDLFTITLPAGWAKETIGHNEIRMCAEKAYHYGDKKNNFFTVCVDPYGRDGGGDESWIIDKVGNSFKVASEQPKCETGEMFCARGDGNYVLSMGPSQSHTDQSSVYYFLGGNSKTETGVDTAVYREILTSVKIK